MDPPRTAALVEPAKPVVGNSFHLLFTPVFEEATDTSRPKASRQPWTEEQPHMMAMVAHLQSTTYLVPRGFEASVDVPGCTTKQVTQSHSIMLVQRDIRILGACKFQHLADLVRFGNSTVLDVTGSTETTLSTADETIHNPAASKIRIVPEIQGYHYAQLMRLRS
ncbi:hypothetical protein CSAL01_11994 [Colletotrichum salicis]|uniref:Uncharacterized protein n=1 Tax=Colletotrichum salicis TaxID=1209931 RepID=A0A135UKJ3_9PEZI|nr:hypothetical protein CSAL01_11994 [Colletotrichum salicis]